MVQLARVTHSRPGRMRVKIHEKRGDEAYFTALGKDLANCPDIFMVEANHLASTVLVRDKVDDLSCALERNLFRLPVSHPLPPAVPVSTHPPGDRGQHRNPGDSAFWYSFSVFPLRHDPDVEPSLLKATPPMES